MLQCSKETIVRLFYNASSSFQLLFLFFYLTSIFLSKLLFLVSAVPFLPRNEEDYEYATFSEEEEVSDDYYHDESTPEKLHPVADATGDGEHHRFLHTSTTTSSQNSVVFDDDVVNDLLETAAAEAAVAAEEEVVAGRISSISSDDLSFYSLPEDEYEEEKQENRREVEEKVAVAGGGGGSRCFGYEVNTRAVTTRATSACTSFRYVGDEPSLRVTKKIGFVLDDDQIEGTYVFMDRMLRNMHIVFDSRHALDYLYVRSP